MLSQQTQNCSNVKIFSPKYFRNRKIFLLVFGALFRVFKTSETVPFYKSKFLSSDSIFATLRLKRKLLLHKLIYFNNQYFSTPTIPAFPSKAYDNMVQKGGLNFLSAGTTRKQQIDSVFLGISNKCKLKCDYCYERQNLNKHDEVSPNKWNQVIKSLQSYGVNVFLLSGGEPLLAFDNLIEILSHADKDKSDFHIHTSGNSVTLEKVRQLKAAGLKAAAIGLDDFDRERHDKIRGKGSFADAIKALQLFNSEGILTYVNFCASKKMIQSDNLYKYYEFVKELNVSLIQLLEPRPCGGYFNKQSGVWLDTSEKQKLYDFTLEGNKSKIYKNYPLIYYVAHVEGKEQMGCHMGGLSHFYIDSVGNVCPCVFFPIKYGNILNEDILTICERMKQKLPVPLHTECPSLVLADKCRECSAGGNEIPIPFEQIQHHIDDLYEKNRLVSK